MVQPSAPTQHCIFLPPYAAANFSSSPSTPLQSRSGAHAGTSLPLRDATPRLSVLQPHLGTRWWQQRIPCAADVGACYRAASLGVSLWPCKIFIVDVCPRSFSGLASPLTAGFMDCRSTHKVGHKFTRGWLLSSKTLNSTLEGTFPTIYLSIASTAAQRLFLISSLHV